MWANWHKYHNLRNRSIWEIVESISDSWSWKMILRLRPLAERFIHGRVGNGKKISFWSDNWTPHGPLIKFLGESGPRSMRIPLAARVADASANARWILPSPRSDAALALHAYLTTVTPPSQALPEDSYCWIADNFECHGFSSSRTWESMRPKEMAKDWSKSVWFKGSVPKHAFNMWVAHLNRLQTRQRLATWGIRASTSCCLCSQQTETRDHLLIMCDFSAVIWNLVFNRLSPTQLLFSTWAELLSWTRRRSAIAPSLLRKIVSQATVFHLWKQRNNVLHNARLIPHKSFLMVLIVRSAIPSRLEDIKGNGDR